METALNKNKLHIALSNLLCTSSMYSYFVTTHVLRHPKTNKTVVMYGDIHMEFKGISIQESLKQQSLIVKKINLGIKNAKTTKCKIRFLVEGFKDTEIHRYSEYPSLLVRLSLLKLFKQYTFHGINHEDPHLVAQHITNIDIRGNWQHSSSDDQMLYAFNNNLDMLREKLVNCPKHNLLPDFFNRYSYWIDFIQYKMHRTRNEFNQLPDYLENLHVYRHKLGCALANELDINTILEISDDCTTSKFIVFAGAAHTQAIAYALEFEGYELIYSGNLNKYYAVDDINEKTACDQFLDIKNTQPLIKPQNYYINFFQNVTGKKLVRLDNEQFINESDLDWIDTDIIPIPYQNTFSESFLKNAGKITIALGVLIISGYILYKALQNNKQSAIIT